MSYSIYAIKCLAVLLVLNSHLDKIYPVAALATGGALGNTLFFMISGYNWLGNSLRRSSFGPWYGNKVRRIFIPTLLTNLVFLYLSPEEFELSFRYLFKIFIFPNKSWFCGAILLYGLFYFFLAKKNQRRLTALAMGLLGVLYAVWYVLVVDKNVYSVEAVGTGLVCRMSYYGISMLAGLLLRQRAETGRKYKLPALWNGLAALAVFALFYGEKYLMQRSVVFMRLQFINQFTTLICCVFLFVCLMQLEEQLSKSPLRNAMQQIADYSWEIYLTQTLVIPVAATTVFPVNLILALLGTGAATVLLRKADRAVDAALFGRKNRRSMNA